MKRGIWLPTLALAAIVAALNTALLLSERDQGEEAREQGTMADAALQQRVAMLRDAHGRIRPDGLIKGKRQADRLRGRHRLRVQNQAAAVASQQTIGSASSAATGSAPGVAWQWLGPNHIGGRIRTIAIHPTTPDVMFAGSAGGGIWKTTNRGASWAPCDDFMAALSVSSIVFDPRNPNVMYASTGEGYHNADAILGAGIFKTTDAGSTWAQLAATAQTTNPDFSTVNRLAVSPDGNVLLAATSYGIYRSTDGGGSFAETSPLYQITQVLFNPRNPSEAIAAGFIGGALYSRDGGITWAQASGFPSSSARVEVAYSRSDGSIYASVDLNGGTIYRSLNGGLSFARVGGNSILGMQGWYDNTIWVNPFDPNHVVVGGPNLYQSFDGGVSWSAMYVAPFHADQHAIVEDPRFDDANNRTVYIGNDGGIYRAADIRNTGPYASGRFEPLNNNLGVTQFYGADGNPQSGLIIGGTQDNGSPRYDPADGTEWTQTSGGDVGVVVADPTDANYYYEAAPYVSPYRTATRGESWESIGSGITDGQSANFIGPLALDPNNPQRLYVGRNNLWRTDAARGASPQFVSVKPPSVTGAGYISAIAIAPGDSNIVWVGHNGGDVFKTTNGSSANPTWKRVAQFGSWISRITIDAEDPAEVFVTRTGFQADNVQRSIDGGVTWSSASGSGDDALPEVPIYDLEIDPANPAMIYAATELGVFVSADRGTTWDVPGEGPANTRVTELFWMGPTLVAATHGRGMFALGGAATEPPPALPSPWAARDIGSVGALGRTTFSNGTFSVSGAGADVWGSADAFHFAYQTLTGDGSIVARVASIQAVAAWTKAGVMIRQSLAPGSAHAFMIVSPGKGLAFQRRTVSGGVSTSTSGIAGAAPKWVRIVRTGRTVTVASSSDGVTWSTIGQDTINLDETAYVGLAVSSHDTAQSASVVFDQVAVTPATSPSSASLPPGWSSQDIGLVGAGGAALENAGTFSVAGAGADVWGSGDAFRFAYYKLPGDGTIVARVASLESLAPWTKAGVMLRQTLGPDSPHAFMLVSSGKGLAFQRRSAAGGTTASTAAGTGTVPAWVKLRRTGQTVSAFAAFDGVSWTLVAQDTVALTGPVWAGLAVSSHDTSSTATATFDNVTITPASLLPAGWDDTDIGGVGAPGSAAGSSGTFTVTGAGADVWGSADALHYTFTTLAADGEIVARVAAVEAVQPWTKAGVMVRSSLSPSAAQAFMLVSAGKGLAFQRRVSSGGLTTSTVGGAGVAPAWVKLGRSGTTITAYASSDGLTWRVVGQDTFAISGQVYVGLAVSSHDPSRAATATFDGVGIR